MTKEEARKEAQAIFDARIGEYKMSDMLKGCDEKCFAYCMGEGLDLDPDVKYELELLCSIRWGEWVEEYLRKLHESDKGMRVYRAYERLDGREYDEWTTYLGTGYDAAYGAALTLDDHLTARERQDGYSVAIDFVNLTPDEAEKFTNADKDGRCDIYTDVADSVKRGAHTVPYGVWAWRR